MSVKHQYEFIRILYKINEIYNKHNLNNNDLQDEIYHYESKPSYSKEDLKALQEKCIEEWRKVLTLLCNDLIDKIERNKKYRELFRLESKNAKRIRNSIDKNKLTLDEYEKIFDVKLEV